MVRVLCRNANERLRYVEKKILMYFNPEILWVRRGVCKKDSSPMWFYDVPKNFKFVMKCFLGHYHGAGAINQPLFLTFLQ